MRVNTFAQGSLGASAWQIADYDFAPFQLAVGVAIGSGAMTYSIEYTYVDVQRHAPAPDEILTAAANLTGPGEALFNHPVTAVRVNVTAYTSGRAVARMVQAGRY